MHETKPSRTAQGVAAERAVLTDLGVLADPFAASMLAPPMATVHRALRRLPRRAVTRSVTLAGLAARVLWFDARVAAALASGVEQVVVIGAGYDSRAWRCARDGVRFFELDHPATQRDKVRRVPGPGPVYVAAGWEVDEVTTLRDAAGTLVPARSGLPTGSIHAGKLLLAAVRT